MSRRGSGLRWLNLSFRPRQKSQLTKSAISRIVHGVRHVCEGARRVSRTALYMTNLTISTQ